MAGSAGRIQAPSRIQVSNYNDPDPLWGCVIEKTNGGCWVFANDNCDTLSEEERLHPERIVSNLLVTCDEIRWRAE